ncbi:hypothetical protein [Faecalibaculum rodentium]|uniref:hypothetical protein n=1 Tax=Faecalibaculum rodentium TaxID=1702221 RepID=UPI0033076F51
MSLDFSYAWKTLTDSWPMYWYGIKITVLLAIVGTVFGLLIGLVVGAIRGIPEDPLDTPFRRGLKKAGQAISWFYIWIFRGTPMMVQAVFFYYLLRSLLHWTPLTADHHFSEHRRLYVGDHPLGDPVGGPRSD